MTETANLVRLTKTEKKILVVLLKQIEGDKWTTYPRGNNAKEIARVVYGSKAIGSGDYFNQSSKVMMSRNLNKLWKKGLVLKCKPNYKALWHTREQTFASTGFEFRVLTGLTAYKYGGHGEWDGKYVKAEKMLHNTKVWWMLTDEGAMIAEEIAGITPRRKRCNQCFFGLNEKDECQHSYHAAENPLEIDECEYFKNKNEWELNEDAGEYVKIR